MDIHHYKDIYLSGLSYYVPEKAVSNAEIIAAESLKMKADWIESRIGIRSRRWAHPDQAASDLAVAAIQKLGAPASGGLFVSTISPDHLTPSTASIIKYKLARLDHAPAVDLSAACAGQIFALEQAAFRLLATKDREALAVATEVRSRYLNRKDRRTVFLFGDGAAAMRLSKDGPGIGTLDWTVTRTLASEEFEILVPAGGSRQPIDVIAIQNSDHCIRMNDGTKIVESTTGQLVDVVRDVVQAAGLELSDYSFFAFHQGNGTIIRRICEALGIAPERTWINFDRFGNSSSASCGIALAEAYERGQIQPGRVLMVAMGAGYHLGLASFTFGARP